MKRNSILGSIVVAVLLLGTGCGGGGSSSSNTNNDSTNNSVAETLKKGFYIDSAVSGVDYSCTTNKENTSASGSTDSAQTTNSGTTNNDGSFTFSNGQICTFSIGNVTLRELNTTDLPDNGIVLEDNATVARFLQTLDIDGNPDNGISIDANLSKSIASGTVVLGDTIPTTDEELTTLVTQLQDKIDTYKGEVITEAEVEAHLETTRALISDMNGIMTINTESTGSANGGVTTQTTTDITTTINTMGDTNSSLSTPIKTEDITGSLTDIGRTSVNEGNNSSSNGDTTNPITDIVNEAMGSGSGSTSTTSSSSTSNDNVTTTTSNSSSITSPMNRS